VVKAPVTTTAPKPTTTTTTAPKPTTTTTTAPKPTTTTTTTSRVYEPVYVAPKPVYVAPKTAVTTTTPKLPISTKPRAL